MKFFSKIITVNLKASLLLNALPHICPLTFITEVLRLVASVRFPSAASNELP